MKDTKEIAKKVVDAGKAAVNGAAKAVAKATVSAHVAHFVYLADK